jgi:hypothetical protein
LFFFFFFLVSDEIVASIAVMR